jgi:formiminotetrahydrofolate cyclodeaminase
MPDCRTETGKLGVDGGSVAARQPILDAVAQCLLAPGPPPALWHPLGIGALVDSPLAALLERVASSDPAPGAGPTAAWTCALAAALVEMVSAVALRKQPQDADAIEARRLRAVELRSNALALAERDIAAYRDVLAVARRRGEASHPQRLRDALGAAADPPIAIVEVAAEVTRLAADAAGQARGGIRGEAITAAVLAEAVARAGVSIAELNLAGAPEDPRLGRVRALAQAARADRDRVVAG